jgi:hypothetical protein
MLKLKFKYKLLCSIVFGTVALTTMYWHLGMAAMTTFFLAYISKGIRRNGEACLNSRIK